MTSSSLETSGIRDSTNTQIQLVNFWPTDDLNKYINLKDRVESRMAMVDLAASGAKMNKYSDLLAKAINTIVSTFQKRTAAGLQSGRDFIIPDKQEQANKASDFELITWLVIKGQRS